MSMSIFLSHTNSFMRYNPCMGREEIYLSIYLYIYLSIYISIYLSIYTCISIPVPGVGVDAPAEQQAGVGGVEGVVPPVLGQAGQLARGVGGGAEHLHRAPRTPATRHQDGCSRIEIFGETMIDDSCLPSSLDV